MKSAKRVFVIVIAVLMMLSMLGFLLPGIQYLFTPTPTTASAT